MINKDLEITIVSSFTITPVMTSLRFWLDKICHKSSIFMEAYNQIFQSLISLKNGKTSNVYIIFLRIEDMYQKDDRTSDINYIENNIDQFILILKQTATMINAQFLVILCPESPYCSKDKKKFRFLTRL